MSQSIVGNLAVELGVSDAQLQAGLAQAVTQAQQAGQKMAAAVNQGTSQAQSGLAKNAQGLLNIGRAIDDVQYGFRGIVNNIEGIVMGLGYGAGVAGAATIAAVAINLLTPAFSSAYNEAIKFFGYFKDETEKAQTSVSGLMGGGFSDRAISDSYRQRAEFLMNRSDSASGIRFDGISQMLGFESSAEMTALQNNMRRSVEAAALMQESFRAAAIATRELAASQRGAAAQFDLTTGQKSQAELNQQLFQAAVDKFGGGDNLRTKLFIEGRNRGMKRSDTENLYGEFARGDIAETQMVVGMLGLQAELAKIMADDYERMTGQARELASIEEQRKQTAKETADFIEAEYRWFQRAVRQDDERELQAAGRDFDKQVAAFEAAEKKKSQIADRQFNEYERAVLRQDDLFRQRDEIMMQRSRSEILGSAADVFGRNINAGQEDPQLKKLDEIKEEIKNLGTLTGLG